MAKIYNLKTGRRERRSVDYMEFTDILCAIEAYLPRLQRSNPKSLDEARKIIGLMKFNGRYNSKFRNESIKPLEDLLDDLYIEIHGG